MKKCCFIIPYFGKLPNYFPLFAKTCSYNKDYDWLIITDDQFQYNVPENIRIMNMTFSELKEKIQEKFDFKIALNRPYKLCDFKPAYGYIFEEELLNYEFWGHCDLDIILGNLSKFITKEILERNDKIFCLGHMILYKNSYENNRVFMEKINNESWYKASFSNPKITIFDETYNNRTNINEIFIKKNKMVLQDDLSINFKVLPTKFVKTTYDSLNKKFIDDNRDSLYLWKNGNIYRYYLDNQKLIIEEYLYMHLQERKMSFKPSILDEDVFKIVPNSFKKFKEAVVNIDNFNKIKKKALNMHYIQYKVKWQKKKIKRILKNIWSDKNENFS